MGRYSISLNFIVSFLNLHFKINSKKYEYTSEYIFNHNEFKVPLIEFCNIKGYKIPHYCYHKKLSIAGNCRMCLVELKNSPKPVVSCSISTRTSLPNSELFTNSPLVKKARENVMEFLLLNHPLDCPICDQGGECDLQDQALFFGFSKKRFYNYKRIVADKNIGPIIKTVMTRCIHCTRCVRFANEIAGIDDLGIFGRGSNSEIGTYINKIFQSELSGNVIDLCPVGALTSKPYPFISRNWEIKQLNSIDFSDSFGLDIQVFLKNNALIKILPGFNSSDQTNVWITDKTRFGFDGMFSPNRLLFQNSNQKNLNEFFWVHLFKELTYMIYCHDHLNKHYLKMRYLTIIFSTQTSLEVLNLLLLISKKYQFLKIKKSENLTVNQDLESNFLLNSSTVKSKLLLSDVCLLLNVNTRFEGSHLNLKLRQRYLKGNFKIFSLGSVTNLTYPIDYLGSSLNILKTFTEGNHLICQDFKTSSCPMLISGLENFRRKDSAIFLEIFQCLKINTNLNNTNWNGINVLNSSLNDAGSNFLNFFLSISEQDLKKSFGMYFLNNSSFSANINKIIELKLLNYFQAENCHNQILLEQNSENLPNQNTFFNKIKTTYPLINLPNNIFFETSGSYLNTEGIFKKSLKIIPSLHKSKEDWYILRKFLAYSKKITYVSSEKINDRICYNSNNLYDFKNYINFNYYATKSLNSLAFYLNTKINSFSISHNKFNFTAKKIFNTKFKFWLDDFYIGGKDNYSILSSTMVECSLIFRLETTNFN